MTQCPKCKSLIQKDAFFCTNCGSPLYVVCPKCGAQTEIDTNFCEQCGTCLNLSIKTDTAEESISSQEFTKTNDTEIPETSTVPDSLLNEEESPSDKKNSHKPLTIFLTVFTLFTLIVLLGIIIGVIQCNSSNNKNSNYEEVIDSTNMNTSIVDDEALSDNEIIIDFITDMYNNEHYNDYDFIREHCSDKMIRKLMENFYYEGEGLAVWMFRAYGIQDSGSEDGKPVRVKYTVPVMFRLT